MRRLRLLSSAFVAGLLVCPAWGVAQVALEDATISGQVSIEGRFVGQERVSAKFNEYRDLKDGVTGDFRLLFQHKNGYYLGGAADSIGLDDQRFSLTGGKYGSFRLELGYDQIPHRFAFDAKTLYTGVGTGNLGLSTQLQQDLQNTTTSTANASTLRNLFNGAHTVDLELLRKTGTVNFDLMKLDPFYFRTEFSREQREGTRPFFGSFGFGNTVEIPEPIDYDTTQLKLIGEYSRKPLHLNLTYYVSIFENNIDTLIWSNPFRVTDSTSATAYTATSAAGSSRGRIDLYPDNLYHNVSVSGSLSELPLRTRVSATASWGWMRQDDDLIPHTINTAIRTGAVSGVSGVPVPFDAFDRSVLPANSADAKVDTSLYNILLTSRPFSFLNVKGRYRYYEYDNNTKQLEFLGHARFDAVWEPHVDEPEASVPTSFRKHTAGLDLGFDLFRVATLTLGYAYENTKRTNREVEHQDEHTGKVSIDSKPLSWLDLRLSYERSERRGRYDFLIPFIATHLGEEGEAPVPQLPFLRKFDEANKNRDRVQFLASVYPLDSLSLTASATFVRDDFVDSPFGLREAKTQAYGLDAEYAVNDRLNLFASYLFEKLQSDQRARQWSPNGIGDPFTREPGLDSNSNWTADNEDIIHTVGGGLELALIPKKLGFRLTYSFSKSDGKIGLSSPVGTTANDNNPFAPLSFTEVDDIEIHTLNARLQYRIWKGLSLGIGALWEKYTIDDFNNRGFTNVPTTATGAYNGALLMGTLPKSFDTYMLYTKLSYAF